MQKINCSINNETTDYITYLCKKVQTLLESEKFRPFAALAMSGDPIQFHAHEYLAWLKQSGFSKSYAKYIAPIWGPSEMHELADVIFPEISNEIVQSKTIDATISHITQNKTSKVEFDTPPLPHSHYNIEIEISPNADNTSESVCKKYWELTPSFQFKHTASALATEFNTTIYKLDVIARNNSSAYFSSVRCESCGIRQSVSNRREYKCTIRRDRQSWRCSLCLERARIEERKLSQTKRFEIQDNIEQKFNLSLRNKINTYELSLEEAVYLLAVIRSSPSEDLDYIPPPNSWQYPFAPTEEFKHKIISRLHERKLLYIHPASKPDAFDSASTPWKFYHEKVAWAPPLGPSGSSGEIIEELLHISRGTKFHAPWEEQIVPLWQKIAMYECIEYIHYRMKIHHLEANIGKMTEYTLAALLNDFSVAQLYNIIYGAARNAASHYMQHGNKKHSANTVIGYIQRQADLIKAGIRGVSNYGRISARPQTMVSKVLFESFLKSGDAGFTHCFNQVEQLLASTPT